MTATRLRTTGLTMLVIIVLAVLPHAARAATRSCSGFAPSVTNCTTGAQTRSTTIIVHDVSADINYVGTVESALVWGSTSRIFRCTYAPGVERRCVALGTFPPVGTAFTHRCRSLVPGSAFSVSPEVALDGVEGGVGTWSCTVTV